MWIKHLSPAGLLMLWVGCFFVPVLTAAQTISPQSRITQHLDETKMITLRGNTHPLARPQFDVGAAPPSLPMARMLLVLKRSAEQETALGKLLDEQQDKSSPDYHKWLTPEQFGQQYGPSEQDIQAVTSWLTSHGFQVARISKGRATIEFSGTADQVQEAFRTEIHKFAVDGEERWANSTDPQIPEALAPVVAGVNALHNFPKKPMHQVAGVFSRSRETGQVTAVPTAPVDFTYSGGCAADGNCYPLGPYDFATIYNVLPLWNANAPTDGTGQSIAIVGETNINIQDVRDFRSLFGLLPNDPQIIVDGPDPGLVPREETEADLDVEWAGAVAKGATIKLVTSASTNSSAGIDLSALYIIENSISPVMSESYGECELFLGAAGNSFESSIREQAAAQGITFINSSGDEGAARCDGYQGINPEPATYGLMVSGLASTPFGVAVGGTDFNDPVNPGTYWNPNNDTHLASVKGYIPEMTWNSSCTNALFSTIGYAQDPETNCNDSRLSRWVQTVGGGGGKSNCTTSDEINSSSCVGGYAKPSWQSGPGVPNDGARDLPDVSLFASNGFTASFYIICESDLVPNGGSCNLNNPYTNFLGVSGTSASAASFAGIMALVNQYTQSAGQGNANYVLYKLAAVPSQTSLHCDATMGPSVGCIFNDVTFGTIAMPCATGSPNCTTSKPGDQFGVLNGYNTTASYDLATGLGSVNAYNLVHNWNSATFASTNTTLTLNNGDPVSIIHGQPVPVTINVTSDSGTPTGPVALIASFVPNQGVSDFALTNGSVTSTTNQLPGGSYAVTAHYAGDGVFGASNSMVPIPVNVAPEASNTTVKLLTLPANSSSYVPFTSGPYGTKLFADMVVAGQSGFGAPTGTVSLSLDGNPLSGSYTINSEGEAYTPNGIFYPSPGHHSVATSYSGDSSFGRSSSQPSSFTITQAPTTIAVEPLPSSIAEGTNVELIADLSSTGCGVPPTGTITLFDGSTVIGSAHAYVDVYSSCTIAGGTVFDTTALALGAASITAQYSGDANYAGSTSAAVLTTIVIPTTTTVVSSNSSITQGQPVTFTTTVTAQKVGGPPITGTIQFADYSNRLNLGGPVPLTNGQAQLTTTSVQSQPSGPTTISAIYSGDPNYATSGGQAQVTVASFGIGLPNIINISKPGTPASANVSFDALNGFTGSVTFTPSVCSNLPPQTSCSFNPSSIVLTQTQTDVSTTLTILTTAPSAAVPRTPAQPNRLDRRVTNGIIALAMFICVAVLELYRGRTERTWSRIVVALALTILMASNGCGGTGGTGTSGPTNLGTPAGVYPNVTITATINGVTASSSDLTIDVQ